MLTRTRYPRTRRRRTLSTYRRPRTSSMRRTGYRTYTFRPRRTLRTRPSRSRLSKRRSFYRRRLPSRLGTRTSSLRRRRVTPTYRQTTYRRRPPKKRVVRRPLLRRRRVMPTYRRTTLRRQPKRRITRKPVLRSRRTRPVYRQTTYRRRLPKKRVVRRPLLRSRRITPTYRRRLPVKRYTPRPWWRTTARYRPTRLYRYRNWTKRPWRGVRKRKRYRPSWRRYWWRYRRPWNWRRRYGRWIYPRYWYWSWPVTTGAPLPLVRISHAARASLRKHGLLSEVWSRRLAGANPQLLRFINRFHRAPGFKWVVRAYYDQRYSRAGTRHLMRVAQRMADHNPDFRALIRFRPAKSYRSNGRPVRAINIVGEGVHYRPLSWSRISALATKRLLKHDINRYDSPNRVRWVFSRRLLGMSKRGVVRTVQRALIEPYSSANGNANRVRWLEALDRTIIVV
jgi:hypothetical protein